MYIQCKSFTYRKFIFFKTLALIFSHNYVNIKHQVFLFYYVCLHVPVLFVNAYFVVFANSFLWLIPGQILFFVFYPLVCCTYLSILMCILLFTPLCIVVIYTCPFCWCTFCCWSQSSSWTAWLCSSPSMTALFQRTSQRSSASLCYSPTGLPWWGSQWTSGI